MPDNRISIFETYTDAARAVRDGKADAYASVGRAHSGFINQNPDWPVDLILLGAQEKAPAFGSFAVGLNDTAFLQDINAVLTAFLGTDAHRDMVTPFGFSAAEVDLIAASPA